ncbi:maestro heat-like repeat family member 5 isoform X1 [Accipiter gentilis]|uniref:maestro heat-like repeat family member 5 isoform X1 n=1 Tax=Astur gentilis TaxID=8957 RepID=UPI0021108EC8|nr:maestro heat-like repeat family member 5 isoform X1 [Accipiter gentilis]
MARHWPRSIHWAPPAPTCGQRDGGQSPQQPLSRGWPCLGSTGLGCVLQPLLQPLSSACARSLPDPDWKLPEEQEHARALFHSSAQKFWESLKPSEREDATIAAVEGMADSDSYNAEACAAMLDVLVESDTSRLQHVPSIVRCIYRWLMSNTHVSAEHRLDNSLLELTHAHPHDVAVTLLCCAPSCDRAAATMWRVMVSRSRTAEQVLRELVCVLEDWPLHRTCTSDGDSADVFALAATRVLQEILRLPGCPRRLNLLFPRIFLALLSHIFFATQQMPEEVDTFWRRCQQEGCPPTNPSRFAMLTVKALLCRLEYDDVVFEVERKRGWDTLLSAETYHCAMGLLARQLHSISRSLCYGIADYLAKLLRRKKQLWEVPTMAFLVEFLDYPNVRCWGDNILQLVPMYLQSKCRVMRRLVLRGLLALCKTPLMVRRMRPLLRRLIDLLMDADVEVVGMTLSVLSKVLWATGIRTASPITLQLADRLRPLFDSDANHVQLLSMRLFQDVMEFVVEEEKKPLKQHVHRSLIPLLCHLYDENQCVAEASRETLLQATKFLKNRKLQQLLERDKTWVIAKYLLAEYSSRVDEYLQQCLLYLQSPQASMRVAAIRFLGLAGQHVAHQQVKLQVIYKALQSTTKDVSDSVSSLATQTLFLLRAAERNPPSRFRLPVLQERFRKAWRRRPSLWDIGFLCCWSSVQS